MKITVVNDFSKTPGGRKIEEGSFSGEAFLRDVLFPKYQDAVSNNEILEIDFDGTFGYSPSFLDESFGGLVRKTKEKGILDNIEIESKDDLTLERRIKECVQEAEKSIGGGKDDEQKN